MVHKFFFLLLLLFSTAIHSEFLSTDSELVSNIVNLN